MKRNALYLLTLVLSLGLFLVNIIQVQAATINTVNATSSSSGKITVSGTTDTTVLACAIMVYDSTGTTLKDMETCAANSGSYSYTLSQTFSTGTYVIKVADYAGGNYITTTVDVVVRSSSSSSSTQVTQEETTTIEDTTAESIEDTTEVTQDGTSEDGDSANTVDASDIIIWSVLLLVSISGIVVYEVYKTKTRI